MKSAACVLWCLACLIGCEDDAFENPCDPQNLAAGKCQDAVVADAVVVDARVVDMAVRDHAVDARPPDMRITDMAPLVDMAPPVDMMVDMAPPADMAPSGCTDPAYNPACAESMDADSCAANGGQWGQWVFSEPPMESCDCPSRDGGCPCEQGECSVTCYVPANDGNDGCSDEPARCWERTQALGCFCDPAGEGLVCP